MRRGMWRAWVVGTVAWVASCAWRSDLACPLRAIGIDAGGGPWCKDQLAYPVEYFGGLAFTMAWPPALGALAIIAGFWIVEGFRKRT